MIEFKNIEKSYQYKKVLHDVNFTVDSSSIFGFVGKNGSGKTTILKMLLGLIKPDYGEILINGEELSNVKKHNKIVMSYLSDKFEKDSKWTLKQYLEFYAECYGISGINKEKAVTDILEKLYIIDRKNEFVDTFSKSTKITVSLARALLPNPDILILDEAIENMDNFTKEEFVGITKDLLSQNKTIILSSHKLSNIKDYITHVGIIEHNTVSKFGNIENILNSVDFQKKIVVEFRENVENAQIFLKDNNLVLDTIIKGNKIYMSFIGTEDDEVKLLKLLIEKNFLVRSFENYYEHNYDY